MYRRAAPVAACSTALRSAAVPLKVTPIPGCASGRTSGGHTRTRAHQASCKRDGVTLIVQPLYSLITGGWSAGICAGALELCECDGSDASIYCCAAAVAACSTALRPPAAPLKLTSMPPCVSGRTSGGHTRTCARHRFSSREGATLIIQPLYWLITRRSFTGRGGALEQATSVRPRAMTTVTRVQMVTIIARSPSAHADPIGCQEQISTSSGYRRSSSASGHAEHSSSQPGEA